jgi:hypothetical protein
LQRGICSCDACVAHSLDLRSMATQASQLRGGATRSKQCRASMRNSCIKPPMLSACIAPITSAALYGNSACSRKVIYDHI